MMHLTAFTSRALRLIPLVALVSAGGCFATRNDVRVVQSDIASLRTELLKNDAEQRDALTRALRTIQQASDTVAAMSSRLTSIQGNIVGGLRSVDTELITVQELLKQSASTIARLRSEAEQRANQAAAAIQAPPVGGGFSAVGADTSAAARSAADAVTGPNELYTTGMSNLNRGSVSTARNAFQQLLDRYPTSDHAPAAQLG
ncbi:MAG: outer membrane protein assembly factor BamD, partial [Gemmatimonadota bacterium]|nr:outer membrane protein assembly factor BamD [Gemmatimonadota bacterium]